MKKLVTQVRIRLTQIFCLLFLILLFQAVNGQEQNLPEPSPADHQAYFGSRVIRSSTLLATSCKDRRQPIRVMIYGQSIVGSVAFTEELESQIKAKFPYADVSVENKAIGGFGGNRLLRTAEHDVYPDYPDLIVFHVYGGEDHGELEQLFSNIRRYTTAEVLLMNHHLDAGRSSINPKSFNYLRYIANKYNCELVDISTGWMRYLSDNHMETKALLRDAVHPDRHGCWLLSNLIVRHLNYNPLYPSEWSNMVQSEYLSAAYDKGRKNAFSFSNEPWQIYNSIPTGESPKNTLKYTFYGNRVDIIAGRLPDDMKLGSAKIYIDGKPVSNNPGLYAITRPSKGPNTWFPSVMRVGYIKPLFEETWTLRIDKVNADSTIHYFSIHGSKTGADGTGNTAETFVSKSGRVVIEQSDYMFNEIRKIFKVVTPVGFEVTWSVVPLYKDIYQAAEMPDKTKVYKTTIVKGLENGMHTLEIIPNGDGFVPIEALEVHRPPLQ
jgi:hypothetical protein